MAKEQGRSFILPGILLVGGIFLGTALAEVAGPYQMDDLEVLAQDHAWAEYLAHAVDIRPSERQERWKELTTKVGVNYLKHIIATKDYSSTAWDRVQQAAAFKVLADDEIFQMERALWGKDYFTYHFGQGPKEGLAAQFQVFWQTTPPIPATLDAVYALATTIRPLAPELDLWPLWSRLVQSTAAATYCAKPQVQRALWDKLQSSPTLAAAQALAQNDCWEQAAPFLKEHIYLSSYAYPILNTLGLLSPLERQQYLVNYLLRDSPNGPTFDEAWALLLQLGKNYELRQQILAQLKTQAYLPDQLWGTPDQRRQAAVFNHVEQNFPEYIAYYLQTCLAYFEGTRRFPQGSPVMYCRDFYRLAKSHHLINEGLQSRFEGLALKF